MVNVIIAHKDYNEYLIDAIKSCENQTIEVKYTIIDDNSKIKPDLNGFTKIDHPNLDIYENNGNKIILLHKDSGPSYARNIGIISSWDFDYFMILDADDYMLPNKCERLLNEITKDDNIGVCYADYFILDVATGLKKMEFKFPFDKKHLESECIVHSGSLISKKALQKVATKDGFYDTNIRVAEDYDLWLRISDAMMINHVPEFLTIVRNHIKNSTFSNSQEYWNKCLNYIRQKRLNK